MVSVAGIEGRLEVAIAWTAIVSVVGAKMRIPHQLRLKCRTRDLHQSLLVKLNRHAIAFKRGLTFTVDHQLTGPQDDADHRQAPPSRYSVGEGVKNSGNLICVCWECCQRRRAARSGCRRQADVDCGQFWGGVRGSVHDRHANSTARLSKSGTKGLL